VQFLPLDNSLCMRQFLAHWKPQACILMVRARPCACSGTGSGSQHSRQPQSNRVSNWLQLQSCKCYDFAMPAAASGMLAMLLAMPGSSMLHAGGEYAKRPAAGRLSACNVSAWTGHLAPVLAMSVSCCLDSIYRVAAVCYHPHQHATHDDIAPLPAVLFWVPHCSVKRAAV
jgi:hypothetical protein